MSRILSLAIADFKNVRRDSLTGNFLIIPFVLLLMIRWLVPVATNYLSSSWLRPSDIKDKPAFMKSLKEHNSPATERIWTYLDKDCKGIIEKWKPGEKLDKEQNKIIFDNLNRLIEMKGFYKEASFKEIKDDKQAQALLDKNVNNLNEDQTRRLNRLLFQSIFPKEIKKSLYFDLRPYYPVIVGYFFVLIAPLQMGTVAGFLLLDEKDDNILTALRVTPLPLAVYGIYRVSIVSFLSFLCVIVLIPLTGLVPNMSISLMIPAALSASLLGPVFALCIASFGGNKVEGFAIAKALGAFGVAPIVAFFVKSKWQLLFGIFPTYWPLKAFWSAEQGGWVYWVYSIIGILYLAILLVYLLDRFRKQIT
ncbi:MAG: ABC transporter permease [Candidatus Eremiobacteraeota bacterium]|nr:ABC transporter permease [Candidatus Eremiobacteraeota bacterium]